MHVLLEHDLPRALLIGQVSFKSHLQKGNLQAHDFQTDLFQALSFDVLNLNDSFGYIESIIKFMVNYEERRRLTSSKTIDAVIVVR